MKDESNACSVFTMPVCICATGVHIGQRPCDEFNAMDTDMEKVLLPHDITTKVLVREIHTAKAN